MRPWKILCLSTLLAASLLGRFAAAQTQAAPSQPLAQTAAAPAVQVKTVDQAIDRVIAREVEQISTFSRLKPVVETYIQDMRPDKDLGSVPIADHYFLGQADLSGGAQAHSMLANSKKGTLDNLNPIFHLNNFFSSAYSPDVFVHMIYVDTNGFDRSHYQFEYVRRYMDGGPSAVPAPELVPTEVSFRNSYRLWQRTNRKLLAEGNVAATALARGLSPFATLTAILHYIGMRTSREPTWPADLDTGRASLAGV